MTNDLASPAPTATPTLSSPTQSVGTWSAETPSTTVSWVSSGLDELTLSVDGFVDEVAVPTGSESTQLVVSQDSTGLLLTASTGGVLSLSGLQPTDTLAITLRGTGSGIAVESNGSLAWSPTPVFNSFTYTDVEPAGPPSYSQGGLLSWSVSGAAGLVLDILSPMSSPFAVAAEGTCQLVNMGLDSTPVPALTAAGLFGAVTRTPSLPTLGEAPQSPALDLTLTVANNGSLSIQPDDGPDPPIANNLVLRVAFMPRHPRDHLVNPNSREPRLLAIQVDLSADPVGTGVTSPDDAKNHRMALSSATSNCPGEWTVDPDPSGPAMWQVTPPHPGVLRQGQYVEFILTGIVITDLQPGLALINLNYDLPGFGKGSLTWQPERVDAVPGVLSLTPLTPTVIRGGGPVKLAWSSYLQEGQGHLKLTWVENGTPCSLSSADGDLALQESGLAVSEDLLVTTNYVLAAHQGGNQINALTQHVEVRSDGPALSLSVDPAELGPDAPVMLSWECDLLTGLTLSVEGSSGSVSLPSAVPGGCAELTLEATSGGALLTVGGHGSLTIRSDDPVSSVVLVLAATNGEEQTQQQITLALTAVATVTSCTAINQDSDSLLPVYSWSCHGAATATVTYSNWEQLPPPLPPAVALFVPNNGCLVSLSSELEFTFQGIWGPAEVVRF